MSAPLHPDLELFEFLVGTWEGEGVGDYPSSSPFRYRDRTTFSHDGRPFLLYEQNTWRRAADGAELPAHGERGYFRATGGAHVEAVIAQAGGTAEVAVGESNGARMEVEFTTIVQAPFAKEVVGLWRAWERDDDTLTVDVEMAAVGHPRAFHLRAVLLRDASSG